MKVTDQQLEVRDHSKGRPLKDNEVYIFYIWSQNSYMGTTKRHSTLDCRHIQNWMPAGYRVPRISGWKEALLVYKDIDTKPAKDSFGYCKTCWRFE